MRIERKHTLGRQEAIRRIDGWLDALLQRSVPTAVQIENFSKTWTDNVLRVSCRVKKFMIGATISATATVNDDVVIIEFELPGFLKALMPEDRIQQGIQKEIVPLLG